MAQAPRDENRVTTLLGVSSVDGLTPVVAYVNPSTHRILASLDVSDVTAITGLKDNAVVDVDNQGFMALGTDGSNYQVLGVDASGHLQVDLVTAAVTNAGTFAVQATLAAETTKVIGTINVAASQTIAVTNAGTFATQATLQTGSAAIGKLAANSGVDIGDVDVTSVVPGVAATNLGKAEDAGHTSGDTGVMSLGVANTGDANISGTTLDYTPISTDLTGAVRITGKVAHDGADAGNPVKQGYVTIAHGTNPTAVGAGDVTNAYANRAGIPFVIGGHPNILTKNLNVTAADGAQTDTDIIGAIGAGTKYVVTHITVTADMANSVDVAVRIGFGTANVPAPDSAGIILAHPGIAPGSGLSIGNGAGIIGVGADGAELRVTCEAPTSGAIDIVVGYYTCES